MKQREDEHNALLQQKDEQHGATVKEMEQQFASTLKQKENEHAETLQKIVDENSDVLKGKEKEHTQKIKVPSCIIQWCFLLASWIKLSFFTLFRQFDQKCALAFHEVEFCLFTS